MLLRLSRAEALSTKRETLAETWRKQQSDMEMKLVTEQEKNKSLTFEVSKLKDVISSMNSQVSLNGLFHIWQVHRHFLDFHPYVICLVATILTNYSSKNNTLWWHTIFLVF